MSDSPNKLFKSYLKMGLILLAINLVLGAVDGATNEEISDSTIKGMAWLASQQNEDGSWGDYYPVGATGLAVVVLEDHAEAANESYNANIQKGLDYVFSHADYWDNNNDGIVDSVFFVSSGGDHAVYETSIALMAIAASKKPDEIVEIPGSPIAGLSYFEVADLAVKYLELTQKDTGGWDYGHLKTNVADNSNTGFAVLGLAYASDRFGISVGDEVKSKLSDWIDYLQCPESGGAAYRDPCDGYLSILETGNILYEMALVGDSGTARTNNALKYIEDHWNDASWKPGWKGPGSSGEAWSNYQATYLAMKGLIGSGIEKITVDGKEIDWYDEMASAIVKEQNEDGSWKETWQSDSAKVPVIIATEWALLTLEKSVPPPGPKGGCKCTCQPIILVNISCPSLSSCKCS